MPLNSLRRGAKTPTRGQPRKVILTLQPWGLGNSLMTPTLKLKRLNLQARLGTAIEGLYAEATPAAQGRPAGAA